MGVTLAQVREENSGVPQKKSLKTWYTKNKGIVLIAGAVVIIGGGYLGYKYIFKKKNAVSRSLGGSSDLGNTELDAVEFD